jgi:chromosome segregation ATPase
MKDLRVLEQQQHESQRKLQQAQDTKQRRLEHHATLETKLEQFKYQNGQNRAELSHMNNLLSKGQRSLGTIRLTAGRAGDDLRDFDRKLKQALASKRATLAHLQKQERMLTEIRNKIAIVWRLKDEAEEHVNKGKTENAKIQEREEALRRDVRAEVVKQQVLDDKTTQARHETQALQQDFKKEQECELSSKARIEQIKKDSVSEDQRQSDTMASMDSKLDSEDSSAKETRAEIIRLQEQISKKQESRNVVWNRTIRIQQAQDHPPSLPPTESNTPPVFDIARLQEAVATETKAAADEVTAKVEVTATANALELDVANTETEAQAKAQEVLDLEKSNEEAKRIECDRCEQATKLLADLDNLEEETKVLESTLAELRAHRAKEIDRVNAESWQVEKQMNVLQTGLADTKEKLASIDSSIETTKAEYDKVKEDGDAKLHAVQAQVEVAKEACQEAKDRATRVIEERFGEDCNDIENACKILNEDSVAENARILDGKTLHDHYDH